jgi:hypothetical protein
MVSGTVQKRETKTAIRQQTVTVDIVPEKSATKIVEMPKTDYQKALQFINLLIKSAKQKTDNTRFMYGNKTTQVQEFNDKLDKRLTETLPQIKTALEQGLTLHISYLDSENTIPHSLKFVDKNGHQQGLAIYDYLPNFNMPVSIGVLEYKDDKIVKNEDMTYNPIKAYAHAVEERKKFLDERKADLEHPTPIVPKPRIIDDIRRKKFFMEKAINRNIINPLKDKIKDIFRS